MSEPGGRLGFVLLVMLLGSPGAGALAFGISRVRAQWEFLSHAETARGRVVSVRHLHGNDESDFYGITVEYPGPDGAPRRFSVETNAPASFPEGRSVEVAYRPDDAHDGRIRDFGLLWRDGLLLCVGGAAWVAFAGFLLFAVARGGG